MATTMKATNFTDAAFLDAVTRNPVFLQRRSCASWQGLQKSENVRIDMVLDSKREELQQQAVMRINRASQARLVPLPICTSCDVHSFLAHRG